MKMELRLIYFLFSFQLIWGISALTQDELTEIMEKIGHEFQAQIVEKIREDFQAQIIEKMLLKVHCVTTQPEIH